MPNKILFAAALLVLSALACQSPENAPNAQSAKDASAYERASSAPESQAEDAAASAGEEARGRDQANPFGTTVSIASPLDSLRRFVRTAEVKFRVRQVLSATLQLEDVALRHGGFVTVSNLRTEVEYRHEQPISRDSAVETTRFSVHSHLVLRVPYRQLDTTLRSMHRLAEFLDYRNVRAEDVAFKMMQDQLLQLRQSNYQQNVNKAAQAGKPGTQLEAADRTLSSRAAADQSRLERLKLEDAIQYSTIEVDIYQPAQLQQRLVANTEPKPIERGFWASIGEGLRSGGMLLRELAIGLAHSWSVVLLVVLLFLGIRWWRQRV